MLISEGAAFGALLAHRPASAPSFVRLRAAEPLTPEPQATLLVANLGAVEDELAAGASWRSLVDESRVRRLPIVPSTSAIRVPVPSRGTVTASAGALGQAKDIWLWSA